ncbi:hypothetical protein [Burkholderia sola]|uniref:hypothetical protein n=1 Tax=Burkholderia sola TaxID=2843302 RepID=UPI0023DDD15C|nr:hypothetical protein [Burkholderia sola]MDF3085864.1 hypothetical protein [Burkholderia sola]
MLFSAAHSAGALRHLRIPSKWNFFISFNDLIGFLPAIRWGARPALSISEMTCCRREAGRRACAQGFRRDIAHADTAEAISSDQPILLMQDKSFASGCRIATRRNLQGRAIITHRPFRTAS